MADSIYQPTGRVYADLPQFDFANVREAFKQSQSLTNGLDRLAQFATEVAGKEVIKKAAEFSVENPITLEQLKEAQKSGVTAADLVKATGGGTIWQETVKKYQADQLRTQLEVEAQSSAMQILNDVKMNKLSGVEVGAKFNALVNGMGAPLAGLDTEEYVKYQSNVGALVKNLHKAALDKVYDDYTLDAQIKTKQYFKVATDAVDILFQTEKDPDKLESQLNLISQTLTKTAKEAGKSEFTLKTVEDFDKLVKDKKVNHFVNLALKDEFAKNPVTGQTDENFALVRIMHGDFGADSALFNRQTEADKATVIAAYRTRQNDIVATNNQVKEKQTEKDVLDVNNILTDYYTNGKKDKSLILKLDEIARRNPKAIDAKSVEAIRSGNDGNEKEQFSDNTVALYERIRANPNMSWADVKIQGNQLGISDLTLNRYVYPVFTSTSERDYNHNLMYGSFTPMNGVPTYLQKNTVLNDDQAVKDYRNNIIEKNKTLPPEKQAPVPSKSEALSIVRENAAKSPSAANTKTIAGEVSAYIKANKISNILITENSTSSDTALLSQINRKANGKYILSDDVRKQLIDYLRQLDAARAGK